MRTKYFSSARVASLASLAIKGAYVFFTKLKEKAKSLSRFVFLVTTLMFLSTSMYAADQVVTSNADSGAGTLRQALLDVTAGGTITFNLAGGSETITILSDLVPAVDNLTIDGNNSAGSGTDVTIQVTTPGTSTYRVFSLNPNIGTGGEGLVNTTLKNLTMKGGNVTTSGGVVDARLTNGLTIENCTIRDGKGSYGGGIAYTHSQFNINSLSIVNSRFINNTCTMDGCGLWVSDTSGYGTNGDSASITDSTFDNNDNVDTGYINGYGAATYFLNVDNVTIDKSTFKNNHGNNGAGISGRNNDASNTANLTVTNSTIHDNGIHTTWASGGGLYWLGKSATISNSTFANNIGTYVGGVFLSGLGNTATTNYHLTNVTIAGNQRIQSTGTNGAGGLYANDVSNPDGTLDIKNCIIANNVSASGANDYVNGSAFFIVNDNGYNIVETGTGITEINNPTSITGDQANLWGTGISVTPTLADNNTTSGTQTLKLLSGSIAIDAGNSVANGSVSVPTVDQRGFARSGSVDIGAYELDQSVAAQPTNYAATTSCTTAACEIATFGNLRWLSENSGEWVNTKSYKQTTDISASYSSTLNGGEGWTPIGNSINNFQGSYDGNNTTISSLYINRTTTEAQGLFGEVEQGSTIKDLTLQDANITVNSGSAIAIGIVIGKAGNEIGNGTGTAVALSNLNIDGGTLTASGSVAKVGALIGGFYDGNITNSHSTATLEHTGTPVGAIGGLIGYAEFANISNSSSEGNVTKATANMTLGGFIGERQAGSTISQCYSNATLKNTNGGVIGGFIGSLDDRNMGELIIEDSYSRSNIIVTSDVKVGGFFSYAFYDTNGNYNTIFRRNYAAGTITGGALGGFGGLVTEPFGKIKIKDSFWDTVTTNETFLGMYSGDLVNDLALYGSPTTNYFTTSSGKTTTQMKTLSTFTDANWSFSDRATSSENIWDMDETNTTNDGYPFLAWENGADINVTLNQAPTFTTTLSTITINEDSGIISYEINATDADNNDLNITVDSNNTSIITVSPSWSGNHVAPYTSPLDFNLTTVNNAYGSVQITLSVNDGMATASTTYDINVTSVNDVPILSGTFAGTATEDVGTQSSGNITIVDVDSGESAFQALNITGTYGTFVLAINGNWTYDVNSSLASVQGLAGGSIGIDNFTVTSADGNVSQTFSVSVNGANDAPTIDTLFSNRTILEDSGITNYELNVSDVDGNNLNIIVESNNTSILTVTPNWTNSLNQATWTPTQDFNLTTVLNGNGIVRITVTVNDGILNAVSNFDVNVTAVNDAPSLGYISDRVYYKNFTDKNITLEETDVDGQTLTYSANILTANILNSITFTGNTMTISSSPEVSGYTDVNITVTDGDFNASKLFNVQVLSIAADSDITEEAGVTVETTDANGTTLSNTIGTDIIIERREENNGRVSHKIKVGTKTTEASSDINGSVVQITATGIQTKYTGTSIVAQADATVTGQASHTLTVNGVTTKAISEAIGAYTAISKDSNGAVEIVTSIDINGENISVIAKEDGTAEHSVSVNGVTSRAISKVAGTTTTIKADGEVETKTPTTQASETIAGDVWIYETGVITDTAGKTVTRFQKRNTTTGAITSVQNTFAPETPYNAGSSVVIEEINSQTVIKTTFSVTTDMTVE